MQLHNLLYISLWSSANRPVCDASVPDISCILQANMTCNWLTIGYSSHCIANLMVFTVNHYKYATSIVVQLRRRKKRRNNACPRMRRRPPLICVGKKPPRCTSGGISNIAQRTLQTFQSFLRGFHDNYSYYTENLSSRKEPYPWKISSSIYFIDV